MEKIIRFFRPRPNTIIVIVLAILIATLGALYLKNHVEVQIPNYFIFKAGN